MPMPSEITESVPFLVAADGLDEDEAIGSGTKGIFSRGDTDVSVREVPVAVLRENLRRTVAGLRSLFDEVATADGGLPLREAQISFEVTASGGINILGSSAQASTTGGITLTFGH
jgi:hypothetical protein